MILSFRKAVLLFAGLALLCSSPVLAQEVTLHSANGAITLKGQLLRYNGETYRIKTRFGPLTLDALGVTCTGPSCPDPAEYAADITLSGAALAVQNLLPGLVEDFSFINGLSAIRNDQPAQSWTYFISDRARIPVARLQATSNSARKAFRDIIAKRSDIIVSTRPPRKAEVAAAKKARIGDLSSRFRQQILALDAIVLLVSPDNPVTSLTMEQIRDIFSGRITNWSQVGGLNAAITVFGMAPKTAFSRHFNSVFFPKGTKDKPLKIRYFKTERAMSTAILKDPLAIGFAGFSGIRNARALAIRGGCGILQRPSSFALQSGDYPLSWVYYLFTPARRLPRFARDFLAYLRGTRAQQTISDLGFVGLQMVPTPLSAQQDRLSNAIAYAGDQGTLKNLKNFVETLRGSGRLPATFRFQDNATRVDRRSSRNISTLAQMLDEGDFDGRELIFAGFSDFNGSASGNQRIAKNRADRVSALVRARAVRANLSKVTFRSIGFGEVSPLACNDTDQGRSTNRRVEVWVR